MIRQKDFGGSARNAKPPVLPAQSVPQLVHARALETPAAVAVASHDRTLTYQELETRANQLAFELRALDVAGEAVGLVVESSPEMVVGALGILKAGAAYLPMDPASPVARLGYMLADSRCAAAVTLSAN